MPRPSLVSLVTLEHLRAMNFWELVDVRGPDECWIIKSQGPSVNRYPVVKVSPHITGVRGMWVNASAHRVALSLHLGRLLPPGLTVDHLCFNIRCVNPAHLDLVTQATNNRRQRRFATVHIDTH